MTGRAIQGNIQFERGSIGLTAGRDNTQPENLYCPTKKGSINRFKFGVKKKWKGRGKGKRKKEREKKAGGGGKKQSHR